MKCSVFLLEKIIFFGINAIFSAFKQTKFTMGPGVDDNYLIN